MSDSHLLLSLLACGGLVLAVILELAQARRERRDLSPFWSDAEGLEPSQGQSPGPSKA